ncbi:MAG: hypothetical protein H0T73_12470 [Ardenticatenales bacterium]|nr:hypothetical protein [Ardenticatenales bacterium]
MLEWKVFNEEPLPEDPEEVPPPSRSPWLLRVLLIAGLLLAGWGLSHYLGQQDTRLREDLAEVVIQEERALRVASVDQAANLSDPSAPPDWQLRYQATFKQREERLPLPQVEQVEFSGNVALVTLRHDTADGKWLSVRAYRLMQGQWQRTPVPADLWGKAKLYRSAHFSVWMSDRDAALLPPEELLRFLEQFYIHFSLQWPVEPGERSLTLHLEPHDLEPVLHASQEAQAQPLFLTSPLTANYDYGLAEPPSRSYHYEMASAVAGHLDMFAGTEDYRNPDETALRVRLREALVRFILLTAEEQSRYREGVRHQQEGLQLPDGQLSIPTTVFLADYLVATQGPEALATLSRARLRSVDLRAAMIHAFGIPLEEMLVEIRLWMERSANATSSPANDERGRATLLRVLDDEPFEAMLLLEGSGQLVRYRSNEVVRLPIALSCLGMGSQLSFRSLSEPSPEVLGEALRLDVHRLPSLVAPPLPEGPAILIQRQQNNRIEFFALEEQGKEWPLFTLPNNTEILTNPYQARFAFLYQDRCGLSVNQYIPGEPLLTRAPVALRGKGHLLFAQEQLYLLDDASEGNDLNWLVSPVQSWQTGQAIEYQIAGALGLDQVLGRLDGGGHYLLHLRNGEMIWLDLLRAELRTAHVWLPTEGEVKTISPGGRWLLYTLPSASGDGATDLHIHDLEDDWPSGYRSSPATTFGEIAWALDGTFQFVTRTGIPLQNRVAGNTLLQVRLFPDQRRVPEVQPFYLDGQIDQLQWCADGALFYRLTRDSGSDTVIATGLMARPRELARNAEIVGCLGAP